MKEFARKFGLQIVDRFDDAPEDANYTTTPTRILDCSAEPAAPGAKHGDISANGRVVIGAAPTGPRMTPAALKKFASEYGFAIK
jgi:hypothetical protein